MLCDWCGETMTEQGERPYFRTIVEVTYLCDSLSCDHEQVEYRTKEER